MFKSNEPWASSIEQLLTTHSSRLIANYAFCIMNYELKSTLLSEFHQICFDEFVYLAVHHALNVT